MNTDVTDRIRQNPAFTELVEKRSRFAWILTLLMLAVYFGFILLVAFAKDFLGTPLGGGITTIGIPIGIAVILSAFVLTGLYVKRANTEFDALTDRIKKDVVK